MIEFKGTKGEWFYLDYCGYLTIQDGEYYEDKNILDCDKVGDIVANANAKFICAAPELLDALIKISDFIDENENIRFAY